MTDLQRKNVKIFAINSGAQGTSEFGSLKSTGSFVFSQDINDLQTSEYETGWRGAVVNGKTPTIPDFNAISRVISEQVAYLYQKGMAEWSSEQTYFIGNKCMVINNGVPQEYYSLTDNNIGNNPLSDTANWRILITNDTVGTVKLFAGLTIPDGWLKCDGSELLISDYQELYNKIGILYGTPSDNQHFLLPNFINRFAQGGNSVGNYIEAGLPNITGSAVIAGGANQMQVYDNTGCLTYRDNGSATNTIQGTSINAKRGLSFDASLSNSIYNNSDTVQPPALTINFIIKY